MKDAAKRDTRDHRNLEGMWRERLRDGAAAGNRPEDGQALGTAWPTAVGVCAVARNSPAVDETQTLE